MFNKYLENKDGASNLQYIILIVVCITIAGAFLRFKSNLENFYDKSSTQVESQQYTSPSMSVTI